MVVGFTGTRVGMTRAQMRVVRDLLEELQPHTVVHGDCDGADADFHSIVRELNEYISIVIRPGHNTQRESPTRAHCQGDKIYETRPYLVRDEDIVKDAKRGDGVLIACPSGMNEVQRSGTWATIRKARKHKVPQYIIGPSGALI